jgi:hypothetical protein
MSLWTLISEDYGMERWGEELSLNTTRKEPDTHHILSINIYAVK